MHYYNVVKFFIENFIPHRDIGPRHCSHHWFTVSAAFCSTRSNLRSPVLRGCANILFTYLLTQLVSYKCGFKSAMKLFRGPLTLVVVDVRRQMK